MQTARQLMMNPEGHALWCYGDEMMGQLMTRLDSVVFITLGRITKMVTSESLIRELALAWADAYSCDEDDDYDDESEVREPRRLIEIKGQVDLVNDMVRMRVPSFDGIPFSYNDIYRRAHEELRRVLSIRRKRSGNRASEITYCYSLRSRKRIDASGGELRWGYRLDDGYVKTFCYGRDQLSYNLNVQMRVERVSLVDACKPRHPLP